MNPRDPAKEGKEIPSEEGEEEEMMVITSVYHEQPSSPKPKPTEPAEKPLHFKFDRSFQKKENPFPNLTLNSLYTSNRSMEEIQNENLEEEEYLEEFCQLLLKMLDPF